MIPLPFLSSVKPESLEGCAGFVCEQYGSLWSKTGCGRKNAAEKLEAQSHNSDIRDSDTDRSVMSDNEYVPSEHSDQEECDHVCTHETDSDGDNVTASDDSDTDIETEEGYKAQNGQIWTKLALLWVATGNTVQL